MFLIVFKLEIIDGRDSLYCQTNSSKLSAAERNFCGIFSTSKLERTQWTEGLEKPTEPFY